MLLDCLDVETLQLHHRLNVSLERVKLAKPKTTYQKRCLFLNVPGLPMQLHVRKCGNACLPCNLSSPLGLLSDFGQLSVAALLGEEVACFWWLKSM